MYHKVMIVGNLGRDPEMRYTPSGQQVTNFSVATSEQWTGQDGNRQERTIWWRVSVFGKQAEICNQYLRKGRKVFVEGRMVVDAKSGGPRIWQDREGNARASLEITATTVKFLDSRGDSAASGGDAQEGEPPVSEDEIPF